MTARELEARWAEFDIKVEEATLRGPENRTVWIIRDPFDETCVFASPEEADADLEAALGPPSGVVEEEARQHGEYVRRRAQ